MTHSTRSPTHPLTPWTAADYAPVALFSGAAKLAASGVAPLVARARGYETVEEKQVPDFASMYGLGNRNSKKHHQLATAAQRGDVLTLMWYRADSVAAAHTNGIAPVFTTLQLRPAAPREDPTTGKLVKYENLTGSESVIDMNPATPAEWFNGAPRLLITEGVLKGDSALTALLRANGVSVEDLKVDYRMSRTEAITKLHNLMLTIPVKDRVTILSFVGVGNWRGNDVWVSLKLSGRDILLAFDGDIDSNWNVWSQAKSLWDFARGHNAIVKLVDLSVDLDGELKEINAAEGNPRPSNPAKVGIDDYLVRHGDWSDILRNVRDELPATPAKNRNDGAIGTWQVSVDGTSVQEYVAGPPSGIDGRPGPSYWKVRTNIGGRVAAVETHRAPTDVEIETAVFEAGLDEEDVPTKDTVRFELRWIDPDGTSAEATVTGPATILMYSPSEWDKRGAEIPKNLLLHPEWPPRKGLEWLSAIKDNNEVPAEQKVSWTTMGWVPVENSTVCSFISGRTVISPTDDEAKRTVAGVNEIVLPGATKFSLPKIDGEVGSDEWKAQVREELDTLYKHYITLAPWTNINVAAVVLAAGLRPAVPIRCTTNLYLQGPPGQGKSWTAAQILSFHQSRKTWTNKHLPGSMKDTGTSVEQALSQTNIWVMDDLAPSADKRQNDLEQAKIGDIIRGVHNGSAKRRSGTDLKAREVFTPRALMITTAENEHTINSVRDRSVILNLGKSSLRDEVVDTMTDFRDNNRAPGRLMYASVQIVQHIAIANGWETMIGSFDRAKLKFTQSARKVISEAKVDGKSDTRHVDMAVDLMLGLAPLNLLAAFVEHKDWLDMFDSNRKDNLPDRIARVLTDSFRSQGESTPGRSLMEAIRRLLASGRGHILNATDPTLPPIIGAHNGSNRALGWQADGQGNLRPLGLTIGHLTSAGRKAEVDAIMLDEINAFDTAQRYYGSMLPAGTTSKTSFRSVWSEELVHPYYLANPPAEKRSNVLFTIDGRKVRAVPVHLDQILGQVDGEDGSSSTSGGTAA